MLLDKLAEDHGIEADDHAVEQEIRRQVEQSEGGKKRPVVSLVQQMRKEGSFDSLRITLRRRLALDHLQAHATIDSDSGGKPSVAGSSEE